MKLNKELENIVTQIQKQNKRIIGVCGVPGAGKSSFSKILSQKLPKAIVISMDGYHLYKKDLDQEGIRRRGSPFTFDLSKFRKQILRLKDNQTVYPLFFPSFDHKDKDPKEQAIQITKEHKFIIVQGLYIFDKNMQMKDEFWDMKVWIEVQDSLSIDRLAKRHVQSEIVDTYEKGVKRATQNDLVNGQYVRNNSNLQNCVKIVNQ